jgi:hypothetical protein
MLTRLLVAIAFAEARAAMEQQAGGDGKNLESTDGKRAQTGGALKGLHPALRQGRQATATVSQRFGSRRSAVRIRPPRLQGG